MDIINVINKIEMLKKGKTTTELAATIVFGLLTGSISLGWLGISPDDVVQITHTTGAVVEAGKNALHGSGSPMDTLLRIVAIIMAGNVISNYIKSRGTTKAAHVSDIINALITEMNNTKELAKTDAPKEEKTNG